MVAPGVGDGRGFRGRRARRIRYDHDGAHRRRTPSRTAALRLRQTVHARKVVDVDAGIHLPGGVAAVADLPEAVHQLLADPAYAHGARAIAAEIAALPDVAEAVPVLEQLATVRSKGNNPQ